MPAPRGNGAFLSSDDYTIAALVVILVGTIAGAVLLWHYHHSEVSAVALSIAHWQMRYLAVFTDRFELADRQVLAADPSVVTFQQIRDLWHEIGISLRIPVDVFILALAGWCFVRAAPARFCRKLDLDGLIREQAKSFGTVAAMVGRRPTLVAPRLEGGPRPADPALNAAEWIACWATAKNGGFDRHRAGEELQRQLGRVWREAASAAPHIRCLTTALALHAIGQRENARAMLGALSAALAAAKGEPAGGPEQPLRFPASIVAEADRLLSDPALATPIEALARRHGFTTPLVMSLLIEARLRAGVLAPAEFAWLKLVDRRLWYALHSLGFPFEDRPYTHPNPRVEALGARAHWEAECALGARLTRPAVESALAALGPEAAGAARTSAQKDAA